MSLKDNGFILLKGVFNDAEMETLRDYSNQIIKRVETNKHDHLEKYYLAHRPDNGVLYDVYQRYPAFRPYAENQEIIKKAKEYLGEDLFMYVNSFLFKPGDRSNDVPWHQDFLSRPNESEKLIVWISLDHSTVENGCLKVIPGSHKKGFREWYRVAGETHHDRIRLDKDEEKNSVHVETEPGDVLFFSNYLIHGSDQNSSKLHRRAFRVVYKAMDDLSIPRTGPLVMSGGLSGLPSKEPVNKKKGIIRNSINRLGKKLVDI